MSIMACGNYELTVALFAIILLMICGLYLPVLPSIETVTLKYSTASLFAEVILTKHNLTSVKVFCVISNWPPTSSNPIEVY